MVRRFFILFLTCLHVYCFCVAEASLGYAKLTGQTISSLDLNYFRTSSEVQSDNNSTDSFRSRRNRRRFITDNDDRRSIKYKEGAGQFDVDRVTNFKVLRDDKVVELRNPRSGKLEIKIVKASALPDNMQNRYDLEYTLMELDQLEVLVDKHDDRAHVVRLGWDGKFNYPLIGQIHARGMTVPEVELEIERRFKEYLKIPNATVRVTKKSPLARILVIGSGFKEFEGYEKILDILGSDYQPTWQNVYDRVCVIRKTVDDSFLCIVVDMEHMFTKYDFKQNIPLKAGDIILIKRMPPLFGRRFKFWWQQILSWLNEVDQFLNAVRSVHDWELEG